jgi:hypothetical protein
MVISQSLLRQIVVNTPWEGEVSVRVKEALKIYPTSYSLSK